MKVCFITSRIEKASARYRFGQFLPRLRKDGVECAVKKIEKNFFKRFKMFKGLKDYDVVFLQRRLLNGFDLYFLRKYARRLVFDYDDAIMYKDSSSQDFKSPRRMKRFKNTLRVSDTVICGNGYLKDLAGEYKDKAVVIPTVVDTDKYHLREDVGNEPSGKLRLGWIGSKKTIFYLKDLDMVFKRLKNEGVDFELVIISDDFVDFEGIDVVKLKWSTETELKDLQSVDIGLMPIRDDHWSRGKCGFKILQYMASGAVPVASAVGANIEIIIDGETGFVAKSDDDWVDAIKKLAADVELRKKLSLASRERVVAKYSLKEKYIEFKTSVVGFSDAKDVEATSGKEARN